MIISGINATNNIYANEQVQAKDNSIDTNSSSSITVNSHGMELSFIDASSYSVQQSLDANLQELLSLSEDISNDLITKQDELKLDDIKLDLKDLEALLKAMPDLNAEQLEIAKLLNKESLSLD